MLYQNYLEEYLILFFMRFMRAEVHFLEFLIQIPQSELQT